MIDERTRCTVAAAIAGRGGAYLGVGGDQNYTMIAVSRPRHAFILDHDRKIVALHRELGRRIAATADEFLRGLDDPGDPPPAELTEAWPAVTRHLASVAQRRQQGAPTTWLAAPALYEIVRELWRGGRIHPVVGDLAGATSMPSIASAASSRGLRFSVVYLSNCMDTLTEPGPLLAHLQALPQHANAVVLRTVGDASEPAADGLWSYQIRHLADFADRGAGPGE